MIARCDWRPTMLPSSGTTVAWHRDGLSGQCCREQPGTEQSMSAQTVVKRVEALERQMSEMSDLSVRVAELGTQFSQFRVEVRAEFSAIRAEIAGPRADVTDVQAQVKGLQSQVKGLRAELSDMRGVRKELTAVALRSSWRRRDPPPDARPPRRPGRQNRPAPGRAAVEHPTHAWPRERQAIKKGPASTGPFQDHRRSG